MKKIWGWQRWIARDRQGFWIERLQAADCPTWTLTEKPNRVRVLLAVYGTDRARALSLCHRFGGGIRAVAPREWIQTGPVPITRIGSKFEIVHEPKAAPAGESSMRRLHVPHGMAFGSGDHATTHLLLGMLLRRAHLSGKRVLDLGTGSGILALAARLRSARKILATDFDPEAIRTARQNESLNFSTPLIRWQQSDVKKLSTNPLYDLVLANLFSGILTEAADKIAGSLAPDGELWLSGILRDQRVDVENAYLQRGLQLIRGTSRGKWVMLGFHRAT